MTTYVVKGESATMGMLQISLNMIAATWSLAGSALAAQSQLPERRTDLDWPLKWHGQRTAVEVISRGKALEGYHFDSKPNRIQESPWNAVQTFLGAYFVARVEELKPNCSDRDQLEQLVIAQCQTVMAMLSSQQSLYELHVVYQLDDWRPSEAKWQSIWRQTPVAKSLLNLNSEREAKIRQFLKMKLIPLRSVDNCETVPKPRSFAIEPVDVNSMEIAWTPSRDSKSLWKSVEDLLSRGLLGSAEQREIVALRKLFDEAVRSIGASRPR